MLSEISEWLRIQNNSDLGPDQVQVNFNFLKLVHTFFHSKNLSIVAGSNLILFSFRSFIQVCFVDKTCEENFDLRLLLSDLSASLSLQYTLYVIPYQSMSKHVNLLLESETSNGML